MFVACAQAAKYSSGMHFRWEYSMWKYSGVPISPAAQPIAEHQIRLVPSFVKLDHAHELLLLDKSNQLDRMVCPGDERLHEQRVDASLEQFPSDRIVLFVGDCHNRAIEWIARLLCLFDRPAVGERISSIGGRCRQRQVHLHRLAQGMGLLAERLDRSSGGGAGGDLPHELFLAGRLEDRRQAPYRTRPCRGRRCTSPPR